MTEEQPVEPQPLTRRQLRELEGRRAPVLLTSPPPTTPTTLPVTLLPTTTTTPQRAALTVVVRQPAKPRKKRLASQLLSGGAMLFAAALFIGTTVPANAFMDTTVALDDNAPVSVLGQSVEVSDVAVAAQAARDNYTVTSYAEILRKKYGDQNFLYKVGVGPVQWPFPYSVPISNGFGEKATPCRYCSSFHNGIDFTPGAGTPIYAIAAGTVVFTQVSNSGFGNEVMIEHLIGGKKVTSMYAHMQMDSSPLQVGQVVAVGDMVGLVGSTGVATGAHLHLEIHLNDVPTDPFPWLVKNAAK